MAAFEPKAGLNRAEFLLLCGATAVAALGSAASFAQGTAPIFNVRDYGARGDGVANDGPGFNAAIQAAIAAGNGATVMVPAGRYVMRTVSQLRPRPIYANVEDGVDLTRLGQQIRAHILLDRASGLTLQGEAGTVLVLRDPSASGFWLDRCEDVSIRGIALDYEPVPFSAGVVTAVDATARTFDWKVAQGFVEPAQGYLALAFDPVGDVPHLGVGNVFADDGTLKFSAGLAGDFALAAMLERGGGNYRVEAAQPLGALAVGDRFAWPGRAINGGNAISLSLSARCRIENVTVHAAPVHAFWANDCDALSFASCTVAPPAGQARLYAANGSGIAARGNRTGPTIERCRFERVGDHAIAIEQLAPRLFSTGTATELLVEYDGGQLFRAGARVAAIAQTTGFVRGEAQVRDVMLVRFADRTARKITLDRPIPRLVSLEDLNPVEIPPVPEGRDARTSLSRRPDVIVDLNQLGSGFAIRNCSFANHRASSIRVGASGGTIENCTFTKVAGHGITAGLDLSWHAAHHVQRLTIRNNTFTDLSNTANVWVRTLLGDGTQADGTGNQDVTVEGNRFVGFGARLGAPASAALTISNGQGITVRSNTFGAPDATQNPPPRAVRLDLVRDATVQDNTLVQRDRLLDPIVVTPRADRATVRVQRNRTTTR